MYKVFFPLNSRNMQYILPLFFLCFQILGNYRSLAVTPEHVDKPTSSKAKLAKDDFTAGLKRAKPGLILSRSEDLKATTELKLESEFGITVPPEYENDTIQFDSHTYYNSTFYATSKDGKLLWTDIDTFSEEQVITHAMLSSSHRQATTVEMSFEFPFYGHKLRNITIATGGFLYMGDYLHNWIAATQYIAPLMANFDTTLSENSTIKYADNGTMFTVQWDHVYIQGRHSDGAFTFQVNLFQNGDISFAYKEIPFAVLDISDDNHPVKIGLSDAYILERAIFFVRRKTIYEYHRVDFMKKVISNDTAIYFTALPTCVDYKDCNSCVAQYAALECVWCDVVQRCSDGVDRLRQSWVTAGCNLQQRGSCPANAQEKWNSTGTLVIDHTSESPLVPYQSSTSVVSTNIINKSTTSPGNADSEATAHPFVQTQEETIIEKSDSASVSPGAIVTIVIFIAIVFSIGLWVFYAYRFPQSSSGQFLIKYRPTQWSLKPEGHDSNSNAFVM